MKIRGKKKLFLIGISIITLFLIGAFLLLLFAPNVFCTLTGQATQYGIFSGYTCVEKTHDGGKPCTDVSQCEYSCYYEGPGRDLKYSDKGMPIFGGSIETVEGRCAELKTKCGNHWIVENGTAHNSWWACD